MTKIIIDPKLINRLESEQLHPTVFSIVLSATAIIHAIA